MLGVNCASIKRVAAIILAFACARRFPLGFGKPIFSQELCLNTCAALKAIKLMVCRVIAIEFENYLKFADEILDFL